MINRRFLNYKYYTSFKRDLDDGLISKDAIVFIQDESHPCIWTHGKEYLCNTGKSSLTDGTLVFDDGFGNAIFTIKQDGGDVTLTDSRGNSLKTSYVLTRTLNEALENKVGFDWLDQYYLTKYDFQHTPIQSPLSSGDYISIEDDRINWTLDMDEQLSPTSDNPLTNKAIYDALSTKANISEVPSVQDLLDKQDILTAGTGISIVNNVISSTLDTEVFVILNESEFPPANPSSNKIYLVETDNGDGTYRYVQYAYKDGQWHSTDQITPDISLDGYLTEQAAELIYQHKGSYIKQNDLVLYLLQNIIPIFNDYYTKELSNSRYLREGDYATVQWSLDTFVKRSEIYTPKQGDLGTNTGSEGSGEQGGQTSQTITIDSTISRGSTNPVLNNAIAVALELKADVDILTNDYATKLYVNRAIESATISGASTISHVFMEREEYEALGSYDENTIYFIYEESDEQPSANGWHFGDQFPVTFCWSFGNSFPITLT